MPTMNPRRKTSASRFGEPGPSGTPIRMMQHPWLHAMAKLQGDILMWRNVTFLLQVANITAHVVRVRSSRLL